MLDLVLSSNGDMVREVEMGGRLGGSDHEIIVVHLYGKVAKNKEKTKYRNYNRAEYGEMRKQMAEIRWEEKMVGKDINEMWLSLKECLNNLVELYVPWKTNKNVEKQTRNKRAARQKQTNGI